MHITSSWSERSHEGGEITAPSDALWAGLINSDWHDYRGTGAREDRIDNDAWLQSYLDQAGWRLDRLPSTREREALRELRTLLRNLVEVFRAEGRVPDDGIESLNSLLGAAPIVRRLEQQATGRTLSMVPTADGIRHLLGEIASSFAGLLAEGDPVRVKTCANHDCGWVIYDESRNRSRRWCDATGCGNLVHVRRHRRKKRGAPA